MSKIPVITERQVAPAAPYNPQQVVVPDMNAVPKALSNLGESVTKVGGALYEIQDRKDRFNSSIAYSKFLQKSIALQNDLDQDPDYENLLKKYREGMAKIKQETLGGLGNNEYSEKLKENIFEWEIKKISNIAETVIKKRQDFKLAEVDKASEIGKETAFRSKDPAEIKLLLQNQVNLFAGAISDTDPLKATKVQVYTEKYGKEIAEVDLMKKPYATQIQMLEAENQKRGSNLTEFLSPDERLQFLEKAKINLKQEENQRRLEAERAEKQATQNVDTFLAQSLVQGKSWDDLPMNIRLKATPQKAEEYQNYRTQMIAGGQANASEKEKNFFEIQQAFTSDPEKLANMDTVKLVGSVPSNQVNTVLAWQEKARNNIIAPATLVQQNSIVNATTASVGIKKGSKPYVDFNKRFSEEVQAFKDEKGKEPSKNDLQGIAQGLVVQATFDKSFLPGTTTKRLYEVDKEDLKDIVVPDADFKEIRAGIKNATGKEPSQDQIKQIYLKSLR